MVIVYLLVLLFASQNCHLVAAGAIFSDELVASFDGGVVSEAVVGGDGIAIDQAETWASVDGAESGETRVEGQNGFGQRMDVDAVVESVGIGFVDAHIHRSDDRVVDGLDADLVVRVLDVHLVVRHVLAHPATEQVAHLGGNVAHQAGHLSSAFSIQFHAELRNLNSTIVYLVVIDGHDALVQDGSQAASGQALLANSAAEKLLLGAFAFLQLGVNGGRDFFLAAGHFGLYKYIRFH